MTHQEIFELIRDGMLEADVYGDARERILAICGETRLATLGLDSLAIMELITILEDKLDLRFPQGEVDGSATVDELVQWIQTRLPL